MASQKKNMPVEPVTAWSGVPPVGVTVTVAWATPTAPEES
jgi:hypothetical protein